MIVLWHKPDSPIINWERHSKHHIEIEHDGTASWADLQEVKNFVAGEDVGFKEYYPPQKYVVNGNSTEFHYRHLWLVEDDEPWFNLRQDMLF